MWEGLSDYCSLWGHLCLVLHVLASGDVPVGLVCGGLFSSDCLEFVCIAPLYQRLCIRQHGEDKVATPSTAS